MSTPDMDREALAIAYLTGQASDTEISEYQTMYSEDESFRAVVREVELWLAPLNDSVTEVDAPEGLLDAIMAEMTPVTSIDSLAPVDSEPSNHSMASNLPMANDGSILAPANDRGAGKWKALACAASLVAALAIGSHFVDYGVGNPQNTAPPQSVIAEADSRQSNPLIALLSDATQPQLAAIVYDPKTGKIMAHLSNIDVPDDSDLELWLIREGSAAPKSLGVMEKAREGEQVEFSIPAELSDQTDILAISMERKGGSTSGAPEGPVLLTGGVSNLRRDI